MVCRHSIFHLKRHVCFDQQRNEIYGDTFIHIYHLTFSYPPLPHSSIPCVSSSPILHSSNSCFHDICILLPSLVSPPCLFRFLPLLQPLLPGLLPFIIQVFSFIYFSYKFHNFILLLQWNKIPPCIHTKFSVSFMLMDIQAGPIGWLFWTVQLSPWMCMDVHGCAGVSLNANLESSEYRVLQLNHTGNSICRFLGSLHMEFLHVASPPVLCKGPSFLISSPALVICFLFLP